MNEEFSFLNEKIKDKPFYKKKWVQILLTTVILAVIFGVIASVVFVKMSTWLETQASQEEMKNIEIPQDSAEESDAPETSGESAAQTQPETIVVENEFNIEDYGVLFAQFRGLAKEVKKSLVNVTAISNKVDWFNEAYQNSGQATGMIIGDNGVELLILTKYGTVESCDGINVTFVDDASAIAVLKKYDLTTGLAVISVNLSDISADTKSAITKATLGNSRRLEAGTPVLALGRVDGSEDSLKVGTLTSAKSSQSIVDAEYTILVSDMMKNAGADGVLINLNGEVVGILQEQHLTESTEDVLSAYAISDIKSLLEHLSNNQDIAYLGIKGLTVTTEAQSAGVPVGVYVTEVELDSPAMRGGIQSGDVIQAINGQKVTEMSDLSDVLFRLSTRQNITLEGQRLTRDGYKKVNYQTSLTVLE